MAHHKNNADPRLSNQTFSGSILKLVHNAPNSVIPVADQANILVKVIGNFIA